jgi:glycosidase
MMNISLFKELLEPIYSNKMDFLLKEIEVLINKYEALITPINEKLTHKDSILITYADAIQQTGEKPLETLKCFYDNFLKDGISAIHLLPCFPYTSDDGFSVVDYYRINPEYGDWDSIAELNTSAELMFDAVINHTSKSSQWFRKFKENIAPYNNYFVQVNPKDDLSKVVRPRALPLFHEYKQLNNTVLLWTTFSEDQLDLNYKSPHVFLQVLDILLCYLSKGARYIRLDAIAFLWKKSGTTCIHLPETHSIIQAYRLIIEHLAPQAILITETNVPHTENISYFGNGSNEAHMVYNFTLPPLLAYTIHNQNVNLFVEWAKTLPLKGENTCFFNFTASHDGIGVRPLQGIIPEGEVAYLAEKCLDHGGYVSYKNNEDGSKSPYELNCNYFELLSHPTEKLDTRIDKFMLTQAIMLTMPGVPGIYYHSILGSQNFRKGVEESGINRRINREKLVYDALVKDLNDTSSLRYEIYQQYIKLLGIRANQSVFNPYGDANYLAIDKMLIIERSFEDEKLTAVFNFNEKPAQLSIGDGVDLLTGASLDTEYLNLSPWSFKWIKSKL